MVKQITLFFVRNEALREVFLPLLLPSPRWQAMSPHSAISRKSAANTIDELVAEVVAFGEENFGIWLDPLRLIGCAVNTPAPAFVYLLDSKELVRPVRCQPWRESWAPLDAALPNNKLLTPLDWALARAYKALTGRA